MTAHVHDLITGIPTTYPAPLHGDDLLFPSAQGLYGWGARLERVFAGLGSALTRTGCTDRTRVMQFPPLMSRKVFEQCEFTDSFPQLLGSVHAFNGGRAEHQRLRQAIEAGEEWGALLDQSDYVLTPAACYPIYPYYSGRLADEGVHVDTLGQCFRHEPSDEAGRLVSFRQREFVRIAGPGQVRGWFDEWREQALGFVRGLGLDARCETANDPFFGASGGRLLASNQREQSLKFEITAPIGAEHRVAVASCNRHLDHFGRVFGITLSDGSPAHAACVGFGLERIAFALIAEHGPDLDAWPTATREQLWGR
ncbi:hypothetical protein ABZ260_08690 [Streptosporangium sp. NPDC006013]|uniref:hypothetical protein n=1 Tax=Streptosporangium sp. NPDC006013 TaxID=3155596 RepID=UPI0033ABBFE8